MHRGKVRRPLRELAKGGDPELDRIKIDTTVGMCFSNAIAFFIILTTASVLNANGVTNIKGAVLLGLWDAFKEHRIEMPFPQREVRIRDFPSAATVYGVAEPEITGEEVR